MSQVYIGARESTSIEKVIGRSPSYMNQGMSRHLRSACLALGIKKTEKRKRLDFYIVTADEYEKLTDEHQRVMNKLVDGANVHHLVKINKDQLGQVIEQVNAKYGNRRMKPREYDKYTLKMTEAIKKIVEVTGEDNNTRVEAAKKPANPYKVGDILLLDWYTLRSMPDQDNNNPIPYADTRIRWSGKRMVERERLVPKCKDNFWPNTESAVTYFNNVISWGMPSDGRPLWAGDPHGHFVPLIGNEDQLEWKPVVRYNWTTEQYKPVRREWTQFADSDLTDYNKYLSRKTDKPVLGYYYNYSGSRD